MTGPSYIELAEEALPFGKADIDLLAVDDSAIVEGSMKACSPNISCQIDNLSEN